MTNDAGNPPYGTVNREYGPPSVGLAVCQANCWAPPLLQRISHRSYR